MSPLLLVIFLYFGWIFATGSQKTQWVRLVDVFVYGPYLIYLSMQDDYTFSYYEKIFLLFLGASTITYNARNFLGYKS
jgi:hypothetical protein